MSLPSCHRGVRRAACAAMLAIALTLCVAVTAPAEPPPETTRLVYAPGKIVPIPASIPHEEGDMVDRRIIPNLRWIAQRYSIYVTDGYSGPLPSGEHVGCHGCHVERSDHYNGLAVDIVALEGEGGCDAHWAPITRLALWAEPRQNFPILPFRWVGYDGDAGHGCGDHLHLSWNHAPAPRSELAEWVEVFPVGSIASTRPAHRKPVPSPPTPPGGFALSPTGGIGAGGRGD
jgi:hypothetical protein